MSKESRPGHDADGMIRSTRLPNLRASIICQEGASHDDDSSFINMALDKDQVNALDRLRGQLAIAAKQLGSARENVVRGDPLQSW